MRDISALRFLVAEDQGFQRWLIVNLLEGLGAKSIYPVSDGSAAVEVLARLGPSIDVVISDLDMPGMDGMELIRRMSEHNHTAALIVVSAVQPGILRAVGTMAVAYGINLLAAIQKPLTVKKVQDAIALLDSSQERSGSSAAPVLNEREVVAAVRADQFEAFFQPKVRISGGGVCGAEALARWRHPFEGFITPDAFMGLIETTGVIGELTSRISRSAMLQCSAWRAAGFDMTVSVNLSPVMLGNTTIADSMTAIASEAGLDTRHVIFEVTESTAMRDLAPILETLTRLRMRGFGLSIDDYGTGYSSMERLARIPFTELKIDRVFVRDAAIDPSRTALVEASLEMASKLGIAAVAEGVESKREWEMLLGLGCQFAQGYYIARPMEASHFLDWMRTRAQVCA
jgi:EAL domain-containing protein (putative c-di-GMP-specific phosphodiesterase class I)/FixJ family two-component response regulator